MKRRQLIDLAISVVFPLFAFWGWTLAVDLADWTFGAQRAALCVLGVAGAAMIARAGPSLPKGAAAALALAAAILAGVHLAHTVGAVRAGRPPTIDIGQTTIRAVDLARDGQNPYTARIDTFGARVDPNGTGFRFFHGFKYGPAMRYAYTPGVRAAGSAGFFVMSLLALLLMAGAAAAWVGPSAGRGAAWGAATLVLAASYTDHELFVGGVNDVVPVALGLGAFALRERGLAIAAGILLGASFGAKLFPAAIYALPLLAMSGNRVRFVGAAVATATALYLPALIASPREVVAGLLVFNLARPPDNTSLMHALPGWSRPILGPLTITAAIVLAALWGVRARDRGPAPTATVAAACTVLVFVGSRVVHRNYLFWLVPLLAVAVAGRVWGRDPGAVPAGAPGSASG